MVKINFRKIIAFGNGGYIVSLPRSWIYENKLGKGDMLAMDQGSDQLTFSISSNEQKKEEKTITIEAGDKKLDRLHTEIVSAYLNNYNVIEIISKNGLTNNVEIKEILRNLAGMEIMEQTSTRMVAKDLISIQDISIENIMRRIDNIIRGMIEDVIRCIQGEDHYESIFQRDVDVNRLYYLASRGINNALKNPIVARAFNKDAFQLSANQLIFIRLEQIADSQKRIARYLKETRMNEELVKDLGQLYQEIKKAYYNIMNAHYTKNREIAINVEVTARQRIKNSISFLEKNTGCNLYIDLIKKNKGKKEIQMNTCILIAKVIENLNSMSTSIKHIARTTLRDGD